MYSPMSLLSYQISFKIPSDAQSWPARIDAACAVLEALFPGEQLHLATRYNENQRGSNDPVPDRLKYLKAKLRTRTRWFNLSNGKAHTGIGRAMRDEGMLSLGGGGDSVSTVFPVSPNALCETLLARMGDALQALHGSWSPVDTFAWLRAAQWGHAMSGIERPPHTLPPLHYMCRDAAEQPEILGWLNYWSSSACAYIGFPDSQRDQDLLRHTWQTPAGASLVKLGDEPLDYLRAEHRALLAGLYQRFPRLGKRVHMPTAGG